MTVDINKAFCGTHAKVLVRAKSYRLNDQSLMREFLFELVDSIGMCPLSRPIIYNVVPRLRELGYDGYHDTGGLSGIIPLSTSHCAIHTWPEHEEAVFDVYSCAEYTIENALAVIEKYYRPNKMVVRDLSFSLKDGYNEEMDRHCRVWR